MAVRSAELALLLPAISLRLRPAWNSTSTNDPTDVTQLARARLQSTQEIVLLGSLLLANNLIRRRSSISLHRPPPPFKIELDHASSLPPPPHHQISSRLILHSPKIENHFSSTGPIQLLVFAISSSSFPRRRHHPFSLPRTSKTRRGARSYHSTDHRCTFTALLCHYKLNLTLSFFFLRPPDRCLSLGT